MSARPYSFFSSIIIACNQPKLPIVSIFIIYVFIWGIANFPSLEQAWWYRDDFIWALWWHIGDYPLTAGHNLSKLPFLVSLSLGRPILGLWVSTFLLDGNRNQEFFNIFFRLLQGAFHCSAALLAAILIWKETKRYSSFLYVLPFLLWPFNGEAVLWRSAGQYPIAALLSLIGVYLIKHNERRTLLLPSLGGLSLMLAMLTNQSAALAGLVLWMFVVGLVLLKNRPWASMKGLYVKTTIIFFGYTIGAILSYLIANHYDIFNAQRATFTRNIFEKLIFWGKLNYLFILSPTFYPYWLSSIHILLLLGLPIITILMLLRFEPRKLPCSKNRLFLVLIFFMTGVLTPYTTILLTQESWPAWRLMYLSPFLFTGAFIYLDRLIGNSKEFSIVLYFFLFLVLFGYARISWVNSSEYVKLFESDLRVLKQIENYAMADDRHLERVYVATLPDFNGNHNPYGLKYMQADSKESAFLNFWSAQPFISWFSWLQPIEDETIKKDCIANCRSTLDKEGIPFFPLSNSNVLCVCP